MHVVFFIDSLGNGGAQRQVVEIARRLHLEHGLRVKVLVYRDIDFYGARLREAGVPVHLLERGRLPGPGFVWRLRRWLREQSPDLVHAFLLRPGFWSLPAVRSLPRRNRPILVAGERCELNGRSRSEAILQRVVYAGSDLVTANAAVALEQIHQRLGIPRERLCYLPNGIDLDAWDQQAAVECPLPLDPERLRIALVGSFREQKNHGMLLDALERVDPARRSRWQVWFIGAEVDGPAYPGWVRSEITRRGLSELVQIAPVTPAIAAVMRKLDALVLPSLYEGFPNVLLEAMASRLPAVATPVGDVPNLLEDCRTGFLVPLGDAAALARALERLEEMGHEGRRALGARARAIVEARYRIEVVAAQYLALYRRLVEARNR